MADVELSSLGSVIRTAYEAQLTNFVIVQAKSDFPTAVTGVITLDTGVEYIINGAVNLGTDRIAVNGSTGVRGTSLIHDSLTYTGTATMFTGDVGGDVSLEDLELICPNGTLFSLPGDGSGVVFLSDLEVKDVAVLGTIGDMLLLKIDTCLFRENLAGFLLTGTGGGRLIVDGCSIILNVGDFIDLGTSVYQNIAIRANQTIVTPAAGNFMTGLADSGNVGVRANVTGNQFSGPGTAFDTITVQDVKWHMMANQGIGDTETDAEIFISTPASTVLTVDGTPVLIAGTFTESEANGFTTTVAGRMTYDGLDPVKLVVTAALNVDPASGSGNVYEFCFFKNGTAITSSQVQATLANNSPQSLMVQTLVSFVTTDFVEVFITPVGHTVDATATKLNMIVG